MLFLSEKLRPHDSIFRIMKPLAVNRLSLAPLGAGDLIDRAVRLYRRHFTTLIRIAVPPAIVSAVGSVLWTIGWREFSLTSSETSLALYFALLAVGLILLVCGIVFHLVVMGGATRNLVTHLLWNEPVSARKVVPHRTGLLKNN